MPPNIAGSFNARAALRASYNARAALRASYLLALLLCASAVLLAFPHTTEAVSNQGLVGYWSFNEGTSTKVTDFSGNGNTGTFVGSPEPIWTNGKRGKALTFDGNQNFVTMGDIDAMDGMSAMTVSAWVKASFNHANDTFFPNIAGKGDCSASVGNTFHLGVSSGGEALFNVNGSAGDGVGVLGVTNIDDGKWQPHNQHHLHRTPTVLSGERVTLSVLAEAERPMKIITMARLTKSVSTTACSGRQK